MFSVLGAENHLTSSAHASEISKLQAKLMDQFLCLTSLLVCFCSTGFGRGNEQVDEQNHNGDHRN
jgi:hypothetical protein